MSIVSAGNPATHGFINEVPLYRTGIFQDRTANTGHRLKENEWHYQYTLPRSGNQQS